MIPALVVDSARLQYMALVVHGGFGPRVRQADCGAGEADGEGEGYGDGVDLESLSRTSLISA
jgi:hypothetical protein